jgi:hypothetical protein
VTDGEQVISLTDVFADEDNDSLTYTVDSSNLSAALVSLDGNDLKVDPVGVGQATITVTAYDGAGGSVYTTFEITVKEQSTLFFSELVWGEADSFMQILELYNGTSQLLDASKITIVRDDGADPIQISAESGLMIASGSTFTIGESLYSGDVPVDYSADMGFYNGENLVPVQLKLYYDGKLVDIAIFNPYHSLARIPNLTHGNIGEYNPEEWLDEGADYTGNLGVYNEAP